MLRYLSIKSGLILSAALLAGCVSGPELNTPFVAPANAYLTVEAVHAYPHKDGMLIFGSVQASRSRAMPVNAHLRITGKFADGTPPVTADTRWGTLPVRGSRRARFSALLRTAHPELIDNVAVELRQEPGERD
jgi:hypothetical protein